jgi:hypothetical protein
MSRSFASLLLIIGVVLSPLRSGSDDTVRRPRVPSEMGGLPCRVSLQDTIYVFKNRRLLAKEGLVKETNPNIGITAIVTNV